MFIGIFQHAMNGIVAGIAGNFYPRRVFPLGSGGTFLGEGNLPCNALPQEVSTSEDGAFVRVSGYVNTTVSSETVSYKVAHYLCDAL